MGNGILDVTLNELTLIYLQKLINNSRNQYHVSDFLCDLDFCGLDNVDLQNKYAIELNAIELNAIGRFRSRLKNSQHENNTRR